MTVDKICDRIGRKRMVQALNVSKSAISNAVADGAFPSSWFEFLEKECANARIECPKELFSFRRPSQCGPTPDAQQEATQ